MGAKIITKKIHISFLFLFGIALIFGFYGVVKARPEKSFNHLLNGDWNLMQTRGCITTNGDFGPNFELLPLPGGAAPTVTRAWLWDNGSFHYNGDGTGTLESEEVNNFNFNTGTSGSAVGKTAVEGTLTYTITADRVVHQDIVATTKTLVGAGRCNTSEVTVRSTRHLVRGNSMMISAENGFEEPGATGLDRTPSVETILQTTHPTNPDGSCDFETQGTTTTLHRICGRGGLYVKVSDDGGQDEVE